MLSKVPGVYIPERVSQRMDAANIADKAGEEGPQIAIHQIKGYQRQGIHGIHIMPVGWDEIVPLSLSKRD